MPPNPYQSPEEHRPENDYDNIKSPRIMLAVGTIALCMFGGCSASLLGSGLFPSYPAGCGGENAAIIGLAVGAVLGIVITICRRR